MFGVKTRATQPLRTGDNICPPSLSVLPSIMVRPLSPLRLFIPSIPHSLALFFLPHPLNLFSSPHLPSKQTQIIRKSAPFFSFFTHCSLFFIHCLSLRRHTEFLFHLTHPPLCIDLNTSYCLLFIIVYHLRLIAFCSWWMYLLFVRIILDDTSICANLPPPPLLPCSPANTFYTKIKSNMYCNVILFVHFELCVIVI